MPHRNSIQHRGADGWKSSSQWTQDYCPSITPALSVSVIFRALIHSRSTTLASPQSIFSVDKGLQTRVRQNPLLPLSIRVQLRSVQTNFPLSIVAASSHPSHHFSPPSDVQTFLLLFHLFPSPRHSPFPPSCSTSAPARSATPDQILNGASSPEVASDP
jgi:hypothetical protein